MYYSVPTGIEINVKSLTNDWEADFKKIFFNLESLT